MGSWQVPRPGLISNYSAGEHYPGLVREAVKTIRISNLNVVCGEVWCVCSAVLCCGGSSRFLWAKTFGVLKTFKSNKERPALSTNGLLLPRVKGSLSVFVSFSGVGIQIRSRWQRSPQSPLVSPAVHPTEMSQWRCRKTPDDHKNHCDADVGKW